MYLIIKHCQSKCYSTLLDKMADVSGFAVIGHNSISSLTEIESQMTGCATFNDALCHISCGISDLLKYSVHVETNQILSVSVLCESYVP